MSPEVRVERRLKSNQWPLVGAKPRARAPPNPMQLLVSVSGKTSPGIAANSNASHTWRPQRSQLPRASELRFLVSLVHSPAVPRGLTTDRAVTGVEAWQNEYQIPTLRASAVSRIALRRVVRCLPSHPKQRPREVAQVRPPSLHHLPNTD